jgi:CRP-like cAMP-binding protein
VLSKVVFFQMLDELGQDSEFLKALLEISFERQRHYMNEFLSRLRDTPQQRYITLLRERPHIVKRVPQHYIASYLGITGVHLSRIKNKLTQKR